MEKNCFCEAAEDTPGSHEDAMLVNQWEDTSHHTIHALGRTPTTRPHGRPQTAVYT